MAKRRAKHNKTTKTQLARELLAENPNAKGDDLIPLLKKHKMPLGTSRGRSNTIHSTRHNEGNKILRPMMMGLPPIQEDGSMSDIDLVLRLSSLVHIAGIERVSKCIRAINKIKG